MNVNTHMLALGWLPLTDAARKDGFHPTYRRLDRNGHEVMDKQGFLCPELHWRQGRGTGDSMLEGAYALELLRASAEAATTTNHSSCQSKWSFPCNWSPEHLLRRIPSFADVSESWFKGSPSAIALTSPALPRNRARNEWLAALPQLLPLPLRPRLDMLMRNPTRLLRAGYQMLCQEWTIHGQFRRQTGEALAVIGLGALGIFPRVRCAVCYRLAMPATTRCARHSQTQNVRVDDDGSKVHAQISANARLAKRVVTTLGWSRTEFVTAFGNDGYIEEKAIAGLLWGIHVGDGGHTLQYLKEGLSAGHFPRVRELLPSNFCELDDIHACAALRRHVDPGEWVVSDWYTRIGAAEEWLETARELSPGRVHMKPSDQNVERIANARFLLQTGLSKKGIAAQLGISQSHLSHLLRRLP
ncbi:hypothetical protein [Comamonas thiooxydans]|uniref:hypothetical protein n=1 Tax=Comamonas thiooxydans TaxID=363952 RepID=UPI0013DC2780|nr:hypothetical protein [Comamonas thiooxydans]